MKFLEITSYIFITEEYLLRITQAITVQYLHNHQLLMFLKN